LTTVSEGFFSLGFNRLHLTLLHSNQEGSLAPSLTATAEANMPALNSARLISVCLLALLGSLACQRPNLTVPLAPLPSPDQAKSEAESQIRVLPIAKAQVFPKVLEVLMDMGFQIRCADGALGQVNIFQAWDDPRYAADPHFSMEATLLFLDSGSMATRVRMSGTGRWNVWVSGQNRATNVQGTRPTLSPEDCREFLDRLQAMLCPRP
jgi:hypothetical protein